MKKLQNIFYGKECFIMTTQGSKPIRVCIRALEGVSNRFWGKDLQKNTTRRDIFYVRALAERFRLSLAYSARWLAISVNYNFFNYNIFIQSYIKILFLRFSKLEF